MSEHDLLTPPRYDALPESVAADAPDPRIVRAEERRAMLRELAEIGMALARELRPRASEVAEASEAAAELDAGSVENPSDLPKAGPGPRLEPRSEPRHDPADSFARLSPASRAPCASPSRWRPRSKSS